MSSIDQSGRPISISTPLGDNIIGLRSMVVKEQISRPFVIEAQFSSLDPDINFDNIVGHPVTISLALAAGPPRLWHALVSRFSFVGRHEQYFHYQATLVPWLWALTRTADCRIFQEKTVPDMVQQVLRDGGWSDFELRLSGDYSAWEYCVEYRETNLNFINRLLEQEGIAYHFRHSEEKCMLILGDGKAAYDPLVDFAELYYRPDSGEDRLQDTITSWKTEREVQPTKYSLNDYNFTVPRQSLLGVAQISRAHALNTGDIFDYPGEYSLVKEGERLAQVRLEELQVSLETVSAETSCMAATAGGLFTLKEHPRGDQNREYLITSTQLYIDAGEFSSDPSEAPKAECSFSAIPSEQTYRPPRLTSKPIVQGPQTAMVVGPAGEEIHTDEHARVKVQFHWDRYGQRNEKSSCWIRVSQSNAGKGWGSMITPRIGHEVIVEFLEGDPDRPIITGRVYNGDNAPPYAGGQGVTSGLKSQTHKGSGSNEMSMDDTAGKEKVTIHSQYDMSTTVDHDDTQTVQNNRTITVNGTHTETIKKNTTIHITEGDLDHKVIAGKADYSVQKTQATTVKLQIKDESTDADILQMAKDKIRLDSGAGKSTGEWRPNGEIELSSAEQIKFITGDSSITLKKDGTITISGKKITISGTDEASIGVGNQNVKCDKQQVGTSGAAINSSATGKHEITGAVVKIN